MLNHLACMYYIVKCNAESSGCDESCVLSVGLFLRMLLGEGCGCRTYVVVAKQLVETELCRLTSNNRKETSISG